MTSATTLEVVRPHQCVHRAPLQKRPDSLESDLLAIGRYQTKFSENQRGLRLSDTVVSLSTEPTRVRKNICGFLPRHDGAVDQPMALRGGADRDRTDDLRLAKPALSQLSYSPV